MPALLRHDTTYAISYLIHLPPNSDLSSLLKAVESNHRCRRLVTIPTAPAAVICFSHNRDALLDPATFLHRPPASTTRYRVEPIIRRRSRGSGAGTSSRAGALRTTDPQPSMPAKRERLTLSPQRALTSLRRPQRLFALALLCAAAVFAVAFWRFGTRSRLSTSFRLPALPPLKSPGSLPLSTSDMAPPQYKKPPQAPPTFTATPESTVDDTKRLVCGLRP